MITSLIDLLKKFILFLKRFFIDTDDIKYSYDSDVYSLSKKSQLTLVLEHFEEYGKISAMEASKLYGIGRLASLVFNLRKKGHVIATEKNSSGKYEYVYFGKE
jgi:hypothetical protein